MKKEAEKITKIINSCKQGDRKAQKQLFETYSGRMLALCQRYTKNEQEAEDLLIEGFIKIFENINNYKEVGLFEFWIKRIIINTCIDYYNKNNKYEFISMDNNTSEESFIIPSQYRFSEEDIMNSLKTIPNTLRVTFNLSVIDGYSNKEIADIMNTTTDTVKNNIYRAKKSLKELLLLKENEKGRRI